MVYISNLIEQLELGKQSEETLRNGFSGSFLNEKGDFESSTHFALQPTTPARRQTMPLPYVANIAMHFCLYS